MEVLHTRKDYLIIAAEKQGTDNYPLSDLLQARKALSDMGCNVIGAMDAFGMYADNWEARRWPRNYVNQIGTTLYVRGGISPVLLENALEKAIGEAGGNLSKLDIVEDETLGNGGRVLVRDDCLVVPMDMDMGKLQGVKGRFDIAYFPTPTVEGFDQWLKSVDREVFEQKNRFSEKQIKEIYARYRRRIDFDTRTDLDFFIALIGKNGKNALLLDELYERIYRDKFILPKAMETLTVDAYEAGVQLGCNCLQLGDLLVIPDGCRDLQQKMNGAGQILQLSLQTVADVRGTTGFHCSFSEIDIAKYK